MITATSPFWQAGFRPFFLSAALYALLVLCLWVLIVAGQIELDSYIAPSLIHGHEMIYGFGVAAITGFILTAMPNWTRTRPLSGLALMGLYTLWLIGRLSLWAGTFLPFTLLATLDLVFLPVLAIITARVLYKAGNKKNLMLPGIFLVLALLNLCFYLSEMGQITISSRSILEASISILLLMITIIGGRIVPAFTRNALNKYGAVIENSAPGKLNILCIAGTTLMIPGDLIFSEAWPTYFASYCLGLAALHFARLCYWKGWLTRHDPLLWAMHVGYLWLPIGLLLKSYGLFKFGYFWEGALHALTTGAIATMILIVMIRASFGHTGSAIKSNFFLTTALISITLSAALRVTHSIAESELSSLLLYFSSFFWVMAFGLYVFYFFPLLLRPRVDGNPG